MKSRIALLLCCFSVLLSLSACGGGESTAVSAPLPSGSPIKQDTESTEQLPSEIPDAANDADIDATEQEVIESAQPTEVSEPGRSDEPSMGAMETLPAQMSQPEQSDTPIDEPLPEETESNVLIAYFTWAENTVVEDPSAVDVDATTSASVLAPGHVALMAEWIQAETGGDLFSIVTTDSYSSDYDECLDRAADEKADTARPALSGSIANMADYDVVFLGYPDWWATCPMAVFTFLESYDFTGKTVIPFCAHGTSGLASSVRDITAALPNVTVLNAVGVQRPGMDTPIETARSTVTSWLADLEY